MNEGIQCSDTKRKPINKDYTIKEIRDFYLSNQQLLKPMQSSNDEIHTVKRRKLN